MSAIPADDFDSYVIELVIIVAICVAIGAIFFLCGLCFFLLRLCGCCGGHNQTKVYTSGQVTRTKIVVVIVAVVVIIGGILGWTGNTNLGQELEAFMDGVVDAARELGDFVRSLKVLLPRSNSSELGTFVSDMVDQAEQAREDVLSYEPLRKTAIQLSFIVPLFAVIVTVIGMLLKLGLLSMWGAFLITMVLLFNWSSMGIHGAAFKLSTDMCTDVEAFLDSNGEQVDDSGISLLLSCEKTSDIDQLQTDAASQTADVLDELAASLGSRTCCTYNEALLSTGTGDDLYTHVADINARMDAVLERDGLRERQENAALYVKELVDAIELFDKLATCEWLRETLISLSEILCGGLKDALNLVVSGNALICIVLLPGTFFFIKGGKQFDRAARIAGKDGEEAAGGTVLAKIAPGDPEAGTAGAAAAGGGAAAAGGGAAAAAGGAAAGNTAGGPPAATENPYEDGEKEKKDKKDKKDKKEKKEKREKKEKSEGAAEAE